MNSKCNICGKEFSKLNGLSVHVVKTHKIKMKEYYLKYISKDPIDGYCHREGCNNKTSFKDLRKGFNVCCSIKCSQNYDEVKSKKKLTCLINFGTEYSLQSQKIKEKIKQTNLEKYGCEHGFQSEEVKEKIKQTNLEKYGVENVSRSNIINEKKKQTNLKRYGVENPFQSDEVKEKSKRTCIKKYGCENRSSSELIKVKVKSHYYKKFFDVLFTTDRLKGIVIPNFTLEEYIGSKNEYSWICSKCNNIFDDSIKDGRIPRCLKCYPLLTGTSRYELEIFSFIKKYFFDVENRNRDILEGKELDIYIPSRNFAIEFDGLFWHSELNGKDKNYHLNKTLTCAKKGIQLIHIFEDEWIDKHQIVKSIILSKLGLLNNKIFARKCIIKKVSNEEAIIFLNNNHLQGYVDGIHFGLYYNGEIVSLLTYGKPRFNKKYETEILRFCNKINTTVVGGLSRLINNICSNSIITYIDKRISTGEGYSKCGFKLVGESKPSYHYIKDGFSFRYNRMHFQKHKLSKILESFDNKLTEWQNMQLNNYDRIWDCGNYIYELRK